LTHLRVWWIRTTAGRFVCILINLGDAPFEISVGDSIAQVIIEKYDRLEPVWKDQLDPTTRDTKGFGSTGR
jgi:dUTP pyrophosphatase